MRLILVICGLLLVSTHSWGQSENVRFYSHAEGLESMWVGSIQVSPTGEIWVINDDDLIIYNGYEKRVLNLTDKNGEPAFVNSVAFGEKDIWIGTQNDLILFTPATLTQKHFDLGATEAIHLDATDVLWAETVKGLVKIEASRNISFLQDSADWNSLQVFDFQHDHQGTLWIATEGEGLISYDPKEGTFHKIQGLTNAKGAPQLNMRDLLLDRDGSIWAGSTGGGLFHVTDGNNIRQFLPSNDPGAISSTEAYTLEQDSQGNIWIGTWAGGLNMFDVSTEQFTNFRADRKLVNGLPSNVVIDLQFRGEELWIGTAYSGLWMTDLNDRAFTWWNKDNSPVPMAEENFWAIHEDRDKNLWLGTYQGGLFKISKDQQLTHYRPFEDFPANTVWGIFENSAGLWFGTHRGLMFKPNGSDKMTFLSTTSNRPKGWDANNIFAIDGNEESLYLGMWGAGIYEYDIRKNETRLILNETNVSDLELARDGTLWIGVNAQLFTYNPSTDTVAKPASSPLIAQRPSTLVEASDGLWIASNDGLFHRQSDQFIKLDHELLHDAFNPIEAKDSTLWITTSVGLVRVSKDRSKIQLVPEQSRTISTSPNARAVSVTSDGTLYFGGSVGIVALNPKEVRMNTSKPEIRIDAFKIGNEQIRIHEGKVPTYTSSLNLTHRDLVFSFDFSAISYSHPDELIYAYRLSGLSEEWIFTSAQNRRASFAGLSPGQYQFNVKARKPGGDWGPIKALDIYVAPPWWRTYTAWISYLLGTVLLAVGIHRIRLASLRRNEKRLKTEIARQTQQLQESNEELAVKNKELKSLSKFKEGLTHMIVHDMKNPLNAVIGLTEGKPSKDHMDQIRQSGQTILQMITNMLDIQKFEEVEILVNPKAINLYQLVADATHEVSMLLDTRGIILRNQIDTEIAVAIDENIILRVFINLFTNAIKYSSSGSAITVSAIIMEDRVLISVKDEGTGIAREALPNIFNKFWQYEARKSGEISSTGLGLTYSKLAIESHKGKISVNSELNKGTTFQFDLPYHGKSDREIVVQQDDRKAEYSALAKQKIQALSIMIKDIPLYNVGKIMKILKEEEEDLTEVEQWKSSVLDATYHHDQERFQTLTSV